MRDSERLIALSRNLWWSWNPQALSLFERLNPDAFKASGNNPLVALAEANEDVLESSSFQEEVRTTYESFIAYMNSNGGQESAPRTTYFCMEYGLHESLPLYSGGLGILAGDHTKAASDVGLRFTAVGLFLRDGYFRQYFDEHGAQQDDYPAIDATKHPVELIKDANGSVVTVTVFSGKTPVHLRAWRVSIGKTPLYLLDTDFAENPYEIRFLTRRLYQGDSHTRIQQEIILGVGGVRFMRAIGVETDVYHMNEGHCAFLTLELLREQLAQGMSIEAAEQAVTSKCVFTTHTPVMAGHDRFDPELFDSVMSGFAGEFLGEAPDLVRYGRVDPLDATESFTMTILGLKLARKANGVSKLNGEVARRQWQHMFGSLEADEVPISHITNGIHLPTWTSGASRAFLRTHLGDWEKSRDHTSTWKAIDQISDAELWGYREELRKNLIRFVNKAVRTQTLAQNADLNPEALTIGFARRFATYKRAPLLFSDLDRIERLFQRSDRQIQVIYAGKAHPQDEGGKEYIRQIFELSKQRAFSGKLVFLENYDMQIGRMLVSGCDVWLNNPRRPHEASGTSGQKVAIHGGLNLSILDGWWPEGYDGSNGWRIGTDDSHEYEDPSIQDPRDAALLYEMLENTVIPLYYRRDEHGLPHEWIGMMRNAMKTLTYPFSAHRMILDYVEHLYKAPGSEAL